MRENSGRLNIEVAGAISGALALCFGTAKDQNWDPKTVGAIRSLASSAETKLATDDSPKPVRKWGRVHGEPGRPLRFEVEDEPGEAGLSLLAEALSLTLRAYRRAARDLLSKNFSEWLDIAPPHLRVDCDIFVLCCPDGVLVRYDKASGEEPKLRIAELDESLAEVAPRFSENVIHFPKDPASYAPADLGPSLSFGVRDSTGEFVEHARLCPVIFASLNLPTDFQPPAPPARPLCLVSLHKELRVRLKGVVVRNDVPQSALKPETEHFMAVGTAALPVGWEAIEIYPLLAPDHWKPEYAAQWATLDLLSTIATANADLNALNQLDGRVNAREKFAGIIQEFEALLNGPEEPAHQFLKANLHLISPTYVASWSKLQFGKHVSDFVIRELSNDYVLVEIEAPHRSLFRRDGHPRQELTHALGQIHDWLSYIQSHRAAVESKLGLVGISANPRGVVIIGRSSSLTPEHREKLSVMQGTHQGLRILTYDDVIAGAKANIERLFGPLDLVASNMRLYFYRSGTDRT